MADAQQPSTVSVEEVIDMLSVAIAKGQKDAKEALESVRQIAEQGTTRLIGGRQPNGELRFQAHGNTVRIGADGTLVRIVAKQS